MKYPVSEAEIQMAYDQSGYALGWRLLSSPAATMNGAEVAFIGLNPGGRFEPSDHPRFATQEGSAYVTESWAGATPGQSPLQQQICALFRRIGAVPDRVLSGNLVPFRSASWADLQHKKAALAFGCTLWRRILEVAYPRLVITMGRDATRHLMRLLGARGGRSIPVGWGNVAGTKAKFDGGTLIGLPHLSRFRIVGRPASELGLAKLFGSEWE